MGDAKSRTAVALRTARKAVIDGVVLWGLLQAGVAAEAAEPAGNIAVSGGRLTRDSRPWIPHGVTLVGILRPENATPLRPFDAARRAFGAATLERALEFGADVVRFQISQPALDPSSPIYNAHYKDKVMEAVALARRKGLSVILSMQWEPPAGLNDLPGMPEESTARAWGEIASLVAQDAGVVLELFNEPKEPYPAGASDWGSDFQRLIDTVRQAGAKNVLLVDGLGFGRFLKADMPPLNDPLGKLAFAVHPYFMRNFLSASDWDRVFGDFAQSHVVVATEWNQTGRFKFCRPDIPELARTLLTYLREKRIGVVGWAFDYPDSLFSESTGAVSNFDDFHCGGDSRNGGGRLLQDYFHSKG